MVSALQQVQQHPSPSKQASTHVGADTHVSWSSQGFSDKLSVRGLICLRTRPPGHSMSSSFEPHQRPSPPPPQTGQQQPNTAPDRDEDTTAAASYEATHVHSVYNAIAPHFSATRHKPWPFIASFLSSLPTGAVGLDVGCGNGKYLDVNPGLFLFGSDRSDALVRLAQTERKAEVVVADGLALPYRPDKADFAICIAVIHHLSTRA